jgi:hypothetical protein
VPTADPIDDLIRKPQLIDDVLRLEFPGSHAPPPPNSGREIDKLAAARRQRIATRRDALERLAVAKLTQLKSQLDSARRERQTPPVTKPDPKFWRREELWLLVDAALLFPADLDPRCELGRHIKELVAADAGVASGMRSRLSDDAQARIDDVRTIVRLATDAASLGRLTIRNGKVEPRHYMQWAQEKGFKPQRWLRSFVAAQDEQPALPKGIRRETLDRVQRAYDKRKDSGGRVVRKEIRAEAGIKARSTFDRYWPHVKL